MLISTRTAPTLVFIQAASTEAPPKAASYRKTFIPVTRALRLADVVSLTHVPSIAVRADVSDCRSQRKRLLKSTSKHDSELTS